MRIFYDYQIFTYQKVGGISRYFCELIRNVNCNKAIDTVVPPIFSNNIFFNGLNNKNCYVKIINNFFYSKNMVELTCSINRLINIFFLKKKNFDIFHPTYYDDYFLDYLEDKPFVFTIHDMIYELFPQYFRDAGKVIKYKKKLAQKANKIIAVSNNTKKDILRFLNVPEDKIKVIHLGTRQHINNIHRNSAFLPSSFILFVGQREFYKNFIFFVESIANILLKEKDLFLVCIGGGRFKVEEKKIFKNLGISHKIIQFDADENLLTSAYINAQLFVFPSLYEGFGLPILEAFIHKCPVALSNNSSLIEIAADAAFYFDPLNRDSINDAVLELLYNRNLRNSLIKKGLERVRLFTWERTAKLTVQVYEEALNNV